jgi:hypothetical protein
MGQQISASGFADVLGQPQTSTAWVRWRESRLRGDGFGSEFGHPRATVWPLDLTMAMSGRGITRLLAVQNLRQPVPDVPMHSILLGVVEDFVPAACLKAVIERPMALVQPLCRPLSPNWGKRASCR